MTRTSMRMTGLMCMCSMRMMARAYFSPLTDRIPA